MQATAPLFHETPVYRYGFFGRSTPAGISLNVGPLFGTPPAIKKAYEWICIQMGAKKLIFLDQLHGITSHWIQTGEEGEQPGDALSTQVPGIAIAIRTADCVPILLVDPLSKTIGAIHAGWKGARSGICETVLAQWTQRGISLSNCQAIIGPSIQAKSYCVGEDVYAAFPADQQIYFTPIASTALWEFDLPGLVEGILQKAGLRVTRLQIDTYAQQTDYFSHRYITQHPESAAGRQASVIMLRMD